MKGGKLKVSELKDLLNASYDDAIENVGKFKKDNELSTKTSKVFYDPETGRAVVAHRGTKETSDWLNNATFALSPSLYQSTARFKEAQKVQEQAEKKYNAKNVSTIGHSQSGMQAELLGRNSKEIITYNKATRPWSNTINNNQTDIRTEKDVVSGMNPFQKKNKEIVIPSETNSILDEHAIDALNRLDQEKYVGEGVIIGGVHH